MDFTVDTEFYFQWHITERCNKRCSHCYHSGYDSCSELSDERLFNIADKLENALTTWNRLGSLSITGGEPWLRKESVLKLIDRFEQGGIFKRIDLLTNGSLLSEQDCETLAQKKLLRRVQVSLEGATSNVNDAIRGENAFEETLEAIDRLKKHGLTVAVMMTISRQNMSEVLDLLHLLEERKVDTFSFERFIPEGQSEGHKDWVLPPEELKALYERIYNWALQHKTPRVLMYRPLCCLIDPTSEHVGAMCSVGINALTIMHDGTIYPCRRLPVSLGNILQDSLYDIWYKSPFLWKARIPTKNLKGKCASCDFIPICRGCRAKQINIGCSHFPTAREMSSSISAIVRYWNRLISLISSCV
jgi:radical SAM protein with 4Fe4S-binding SPASM domain